LGVSLYGDGIEQFFCSLFIFKNSELTASEQSYGFQVAKCSWKGQLSCG